MTARALQPSKPSLVVAQNRGGGIDVKRHARADRWKASLCLPSGESVALHSPQAPLDEARAQIRACASGNPRIIAIVGAGLGYLTEAAAERFPDARLVVLEPIPALASHAKERTPALYVSERVRVVTGPQFDANGDLWRLFDVADASEPEPALVINPALQRVMPAALATAVVLIRRATAAARMNARARRDNAGRYVVNTLRNLPHIIDGFDPNRLVGQFTGVPAVLVAAGPSLDRNLPLLRALGQRALIVATDTSWRPLVTAGIDPHLVVALDPSPLNGRHLMGIEPRHDTWVLAEGSVDPDALRPLAGRVGMFRVGMHHPWPWLTQLGVSRPYTQVWGSVLTGVFDLAVSFGCDPLIFIGADLAYTNRQPHCRGTIFETFWARQVAHGSSLRQVWDQAITARPTVVEGDVHGRRAITAAHLVEFRNWLVSHAGKQTGRRVVNATGDGILVGPGIEQSDLVSALESLPDHGDSIRSTLHQLLTLREVPVERQRVVDGFATLERSLSAGELPSTVSEWIAFGQPSLTSGDIRTAAARGLADLECARLPIERDEQERSRSADAPALKLHEADRVAQMRARLTGDRNGLDGCLTPAPSTEVRSDHGWQTDVAQIFTSISSLPRLIDTGENGPSDSFADTVPLSCRFNWTPAAARHIAALEELLLERDDAVGIVTPGDDSWSGPVTPLLDAGDTLETSPVDVEELARIELVSLQQQLVNGNDRDTESRRKRLTCAALRAATNPIVRLPSEEPHRLELFVNDRSFPLPIHIDALMPALTGTLAWANDNCPASGSRAEHVWPDVRAVNLDDGGDPRLRFLTTDVDYLEPDVLRGLPTGFSLAAAAHDRIVFAPRWGHESLYVTADGAFEPASRWPIPIIGEVPWGAEGGALAWNSAESTIMLRPRGGDEPLVEQVPFRPVRMALAEDGTPFWSAVGGGVWSWLPGRPGRLIASTPVWGGLRVEGDELIVASIARDSDGRALRRRVRHEWRCTLAGADLRQVQAPREGQCLSLARTGRWTARAYPFSDLVRLDSSDGRVLVLACYAPSVVAWAGHSLAVCAADGVVLMFHDMLDRLTALSTRAASTGE